MKLRRTKIRRRLFLDDDPIRAEAFLRDHPDAIWVQTAAECVEKLLEGWDEVHLDHDLGGEAFVDTGRVDCGMEVVRWLTKEPRRHLRRTRFTVHSHNMAAACVMLMEIRAMGFRVEARPFGLVPPEVVVEPRGLRRRWAEALDLVRKLRGRGPVPRPSTIDHDPADGIP